MQAQVKYSLQDNVDETSAQCMMNGQAHSDYQPFELVFHRTHLNLQLYFLALIAAGHAS